MSKRTLAAIVAASSTAVVLVAAPNAAADDTFCTGVVTGAHDNVVVPSGASCFVVAAQIRGNLKAEPGSVVIDVRGSEIRGNVQGDTFQSFDLHNSTVGGNVQLKKFSQNVQVCASQIRQDLQVEEGNGRVLVGGESCLPVGGGNTVGENLQVYKNVVTDPTFGMDVDANTVGKNLQVYENRGPALKTVQGNVVGQIVQCFKNEMPFIGGPNIAPEKQGQCF
jgi:hypothetical protein